MINNCKDGLYFLCSRCLKAAENITNCSTCCFSSLSNSLSNLCSNTRGSLPIPIESKTCIPSSCHVSFPISVESKNNCKIPPINNISFPVSHDVIACTSYSINNNFTFDNDSYTPTNDNVDLWHNRLGHVPFVKMRNIPTLPANFSPK